MKARRSQGEGLLVRNRALSETDRAGGNRTVKKPADRWDARGPSQGEDIEAGATLPTSNLGWAAQESLPPYANPFSDPDLAGMRDGFAFFEGLKQRIAQGENVRLISDLDNTVADTVLGRHRYVLERLDAEAGTQHAAGLQREHIGATWQETADRLGIAGATRARFGELWEEFFFDAPAIATDQPMSPMVALYQSLGVPIEFLTGRWESMKDATEKQLEAWGFGGSRVDLKPESGYEMQEGTARYKSESLERAMRESPGATIVFVTESREDIARIQRDFPGMQTVLLDTTFERGGFRVAEGTPVLPALISHPPVPLTSAEGDLAQVAQWLAWAEAAQASARSWGIAFELDGPSREAASRLADRIGGELGERLRAVSR